MKKIINGKKYDTTTAMEICSWDKYDGQNYEWYKTLYQKRTGEFFVKVEGGNSIWSPKDGIIPLEIEETKKICEEFLSAEKFEEIFGKIVEDDSIRQTTVNLKKSVWETLKRQAQEKQTTVSGLINEIVEKMN